MEFEWDENKNVANIKKHGIAFEDASKIFFSRRIEKRSDFASEERYVSIGEVNNRVSAVVYTMRGEKHPHYFSKKGQKK